MANEYSNNVYQDPYAGSLDHVKPGKPIQPPSAAPSAEVASEKICEPCGTPRGEGCWGHCIDSASTIQRWKISTLIDAAYADVSDAGEFVKYEDHARRMCKALGELTAARESITAQRERGNEYKAIAQAAEATVGNAATRIERLTEELAKAKEKLSALCECGLMIGGHFVQPLPCPYDELPEVKKLIDELTAERAKCAELERWKSEAEERLIDAGKAYGLETEKTEQQAAQIAGLREALEKIEFLISDTTRGERNALAIIKEILNK